MGEYGHRVSLNRAAYGREARNADEVGQLEDPRVLALTHGLRLVGKQMDKSAG